MSGQGEMMSWRNSSYSPEPAPPITDESMLSYLEERTARYSWMAPDLWVEDPGVFRVKTVGHFHVDVMLLMHTAAIIMTPTGEEGRMGYVDRWCYMDVRAALAAAEEWAGDWPLSEPVGWHRHPATGRRRPGGDPTQEEVRM